MPISFSCPHCGKQTVVADQFAGQTGPCAACNQMVTIPLASPAAAGHTSGPTGGGAGVGAVLAAILGIFLVGVLLCGGLGFLLLRPAYTAAGANAKQSASMNNLKQLGLALHMYHDTYGKFPPAVVTDANGQPLYSGRVLLLPFLERNDLYQPFDKNKAWDSPENAPISMTPVRTFTDPAYTGANTSGSNYLFVTGPGTVFEAGKSVNFASITDGTSNTLLMVESSAGASNWAKPDDWDAATNRLPMGNHNGVVLVLFADGSTRAVVPGAVGGYLSQLTVRNDGQPLPQF